MSKESPDGGHVVQCCRRNLTPAARDVLDDDRHTVRERACLQRCGQCDDTGFVVVDGLAVEYDAGAPAETLPAGLRVTDR